MLHKLSKNIDEASINNKEESKKEEIISNISENEKKEYTYENRPMRTNTSLLLPDHKPSLIDRKLSHMKIKKTASNDDNNSIKINIESEKRVSDETDS